MLESFTLKRLFGIAGKFTIPAYQWAYAWGDSQREQLIEDLKYANSYYYMEYGALTFVAARCARRAECSLGHRSNVLGVGMDD